MQLVRTTTPFGGENVGEFSYLFILPLVPGTKRLKHYNGNKGIKQDHL